MEPTNRQFHLVLQQWMEIYQRRSMHDFIRFIKHAGMSMGQLGTLMRLYHGDTCGVSELATHLDVTNAAASQMVERMVQAGLLERTEDPVDRRSKTIALTQQGKLLVQDSFKARSHWMENLAQILSPEQQASIIQALTLLTRAAESIQEVEGRCEPDALRGSTDRRIDS